MGRTRKINLVGKTYLPDSQWDRIRDWFPAPPPRPRGGRPPHPHRECLEGILFVLVTGCQWEKLPDDYPSPSTCWRRFDEWTRSGLFERIWRLLLEDLEELREIDWREAAADAWFVRAKKGATASATPNAARGPRSWTSSMTTGHRWPCTAPLPTAAK